jgi:hypothetical protein
MREYSRTSSGFVCCLLATATGENPYTPGAWNAFANALSSVFTVDHWELVVLSSGGLFIIFSIC